MMQLLAILQVRAMTTKLLMIEERGVQRKEVKTSGVVRKFLAPLMIVLGLLCFSGAGQEAFAQVVNNKNQVSQVVDPNPSGNWDVRENYFKRFPFAKKAWDSDRRQKYNDTNLDESMSGVPHIWAAYTPVVKECTSGYGIAYLQTMMMATGTPASARDDELFSNLLTTYGLPISDTQYQIIHRENLQRLLELLYDPERIMWATTTTAQQQAAGASNSLAGVSEQSFATALDRIINCDGSGTLINVANEGTVTGLAFRGGGSDRAIAEAIYMVQRMYKQVFIPMAVLFLLPGAVMSQAVGVVRRGFAIGGQEAQHPFDGILRSIVAVFLIPGTQVIVSWSIDAGNSMAYAVRDWVNARAIQDWAHKLSYNTKPENYDNTILRPQPRPGSTKQGGSSADGKSGSSGSNYFAWLGPLGSLFQAVLGFFGLSVQGEGLAAQQPETTSVHERQAWLSMVMQGGLNGMMFFASLTLTVLCAFQLVVMCYLFLLGPLAAAFYAWPSIGLGSVNGSTQIFRGVFGGWVVAVINLALWRFLWMVVLAVITQRLIYIGGESSDLQWEVAMFTCFLGILLYVPGAFFTFNPAAGLASADKLNQQFNKGGGGGSGGGQGGASGGASGNESIGQSSQGGDSNSNVNNQNNNESSGGQNDSASGSEQSGQKSEGLQGDVQGKGQSQNSGEGSSKESSNGSPQTSMPPSAGGQGQSQGQMSQGNSANGVPMSGGNQQASASQSGSNDGGKGSQQGNMSANMPPVSLSASDSGSDSQGAKTMQNPSASPAQVAAGKGDAQAVTASVSGGSQGGEGSQDSGSNASAGNNEGSQGSSDSGKQNIATSASTSTQMAMSDTSSATPNLSPPPSSKQDEA
jgi:hypothetical protein